ncbi:hypothetical protein [Burkholderia thailandensis]|uniref:hypothetical protein n=1 Tax=Burkholderia thailandensis TaxID=57975 RepID=UPI00107E92C1|nr:hypothetical protein [Burkholderia thailandensis]MCS3393329.1 hypothetical protein [Burkholderia thailandensis]MCS6426611.1 hypothetical protein [Burkholderia thailandensis]MCS6454847.1 hypothetical protein [Burkholderia thailandensis]MCS6465827.1 hypothetical protein [Burkholderia thailandensis]MCS6484360.1 hypothetical protein [Burkholderia thailandensis]
MGMDEIFFAVAHALPHRRHAESPSIPPTYKQILEIGVPIHIGNDIRLFYQRDNVVLGSVAITPAV